MPIPDKNRTADFTPPPEPPLDPNRDTLALPIESGPSTTSYPTGAVGRANDSASGSASPAGVATDALNSLPDIPGYAVEGEIARGGMGVVYRARNLRLNRPAAIKMIIGGKYHDPVARVRFLIEAEAVAQLDHPHVVHVHEFGTHDNLPFFALEFVGGGTLAEKLAREGKPAPRAAAELVLKLAEGITAAHAKGIIHRDLKPANVLLTETGEPKVVDFGLAKVGQSDMTATGAVMGTPSYMSPEQAAGRVREVGVATDVYALGAILYELLTGLPPFKGESSMETIQQVLIREPERPRAINVSIPRDLETICLKCLEKNAKQRYGTATELGADLLAFLDGRPIHARPVSRIERAVKWVRRNPVVAGAAVAVVLALAVGASVSYLKYRETEVALGKADDALAEEAKQRREADVARKKAEENERAERWGRYRSNIAAASAALQLQNSGAARLALEDAPPEHRNWEWRYLNNQLDDASLVVHVPGGKVASLVLSPTGQQIAVCCYFHNEVHLYDLITGRHDAVLRGHSAPTTSVAYRSDGRQVATAGNDHTIRLWDPATGRETALLKAEAASSNLDRDPLVAYSSDGSRLATYASYARDDGGVTSRLWDTTTGKEIGVLANWQGNVHPLAFSPDGKRVAVGSGEYVRLCDAVTGRQIAVLGPHAKQVTHLTFSSDNKRIASVAQEGSHTIHLWDGESGKEVAVLPGHSSTIGYLLFSPDGSRLISGSAYPDNTARLWDAATGGSLSVLSGHKNGIWSIAFSPDSRRTVTASSDQTARLWDTHTGKPIAVLGGHTSRVKHVVFSPNGKRFVTASDDATLRLWDGQTGELIGALRGHSNAFWCPPVFTPDGSRLVSASDDGTVRVWDMSLLERNGILKGHGSYVYDVAFSPNGEQVASVAWDGTARLWDATTGGQTGELKHRTQIITSVAYRRDGRQLVTAGRERGFNVWDVASQNEVCPGRFQASGSEDNRACFNPDGTLVALGTHEGPVRLWNLATVREVARLVGHEKRSIDVAFHPEGRLLATTGEDRTIRLWDVATHSPIAVLRGHTDIVLCVAFSADGKLLASGSNDKTVRLWDVQTHEQIEFVPVGSLAFGVAFSTDGKRLAAACRDNTIRLIDVAHRQQVAELRGHTDYVHAVSWSPDGTRLASGSGDYTVRIWDSLSVQERAKRARTK